MMSRTGRAWPAAVAAAGSGLLVMGASGQVVFKGTGVPRPGAAGGRTAVSALSADGRVVVGWSGSDVGPARAMRWTESGGLEDLGTLPGADTSQAFGVNRDGTVVVGSSRLQGDAGRSFRWVLGVGMEDIGGVPSAPVNVAYGVSGDGSVVTGISGPQAVRWTSATGVVGLGALPGGNGQSAALGISLDGSSIVGSSASHAFRWRPGGGMEDLGLPAESVQGMAMGVSDDGSVVVGTVYVGGLSRALRWSGDGIENLGAPPHGTNVYALAVSGDGATVVGESDDEIGGHAMSWSRATGMVDLNARLAGLGADLTGWVLVSARGVSWDGTIIAGTGMHNGRTEGWVAWIGRCAANCDGSTTAPILNVADYICFMNQFAAGDLRANCDGSETPPVVNVADYVCFTNLYARGCGPG